MDLDKLMLLQEYVYGKEHYLLIFHGKLITIIKNLTKSSIWIKWVMTKSPLNNLILPIPKTDEFLKFLWITFVHMRHFLTIQTPHCKSQ